MISSLLTCDAVMRASDSIDETHVREAMICDVSALLPLIESYWSFENIQGFEARQIADILRRVLTESDLGTAWIAVVDGVAVAICWR